VAFWKLWFDCFFVPHKPRVRAMLRVRRRVRGRVKVRGRVNVRVRVKVRVRIEVTKGFHAPNPNPNPNPNPRAGLRIQAILINWVISTRASLHSG